MASTTGDRVIRIRNPEDYEQHLTKDTPLIIDFSAHWCGPSKTIQPKFKELSNQYTNITFLHVDIDDMRDHPEVRKIASIPTFQFYKAGTRVFQFAGANPDKLKKCIEEKLAE